MSDKHPNVAFVESFWNFLNERKVDEFFSAFADDMIWLGWTTEGVPDMMTKQHMIEETRAMGKKLDSASSELLDLEAVGPDIVMGKCHAKRSSGDLSVDSVFPILFRINDGKLTYGADFQTKAAADFWREVTKRTG